MLAELWKRQAPHMVGIDIGSYEIKAILLGQTSHGYKILSHAAVPLKKGAVNDHEIQDNTAVIEALKQMKKSLPNGTKFASVAVSGSAVMTKVIYMDASLSEEEMEAQIEIEADNLIPYSLDEVNIDFETLNINSVDKSKVEVLLSACRSENIESRTDMLDEINLEAKVVDVEGYALGRAFEIVKGQLGINESSEQVVALVDIGANTTTFSVVEGGETTFIREQAFGGEQFTQSILSFYGMSYEQAEAAKLEGELPRNYLLEVLQPFQMQLLQQIKRTLQIYCTSSGQDKVDHIVLCGGTSSLEGLANLLTNELSIHTVVADPFSGTLQAEEATLSILKPQISKYMLACGLALRELWPMANINLLPWRDEAREKQKRDYTGILAFVFLVSGLLVYLSLLTIDMMTDEQRERNSYLQAEISVLDKEIAEIRLIREKKKDIERRTEIILGLQQSRNLPTHVLDEIVRIVPPGIYLSSIEKKGSILWIEGHTESNNNVANMMRKVKASSWLQDPNMQSIVLQTAGVRQQHKFTLKVTIGAEEVRALEGASQ